MRSVPALGWAVGISIQRNSNWANTSSEFDFLVGGEPNEYMLRYDLVASLVPISNATSFPSGEAMREPVVYINYSFKNYLSKQLTGIYLHLGCQLISPLAVYSTSGGGFWYAYYDSEEGKTYSDIFIEEEQFHNASAKLFYPGFS